MANYPTPHINASPEDFAKTVLMPGDPLRAKFIAETFLEDAKLVNNVRGIQGYTGTYKGKKVSVMASGMGMPSIGIYSYELFNFFGVENIIRIGSTGSLSNDVNIRDIVMAMGASTNSNYARQYELPGTYAPIADYPLLSTAIEEAKKENASFHVGNVLSSDTFYDAQADANEKFGDRPTQAQRPNYPEPSDVRKQKQQPQEEEVVEKPQKEKKKKEEPEPLYNGPEEMPEDMSDRVSNPSTQTGETQALQ